MVLPDLPSLIVIVKPKSRLAEECFTYPENASRCWTENVVADHADTAGLVFREPSNVAAATTAVYLHLNLTFRPKDLLKGFIFGTDDNTCDVLLQRSRAGGISGNQFSIQIDWDSGNPMLSCLSDTGIRLKDECTGKYVRTLSRDEDEIVLPGTTLLVEVIHRFDLTISCPERGRLQPMYDENLQDYYRRYSDAVPDVSTMSLNRPDMTPFILRRCKGLNEGEYYTTYRIPTGDAEYDGKVFLYSAKRKTAADEVERTASPEPEPIPRTKGKQLEERPTQPDTSLSQSNSVRSDTMGESFSDNPKSDVYVVKHFRDKKGVWNLPKMKAQRLSELKHMNILRVIDFVLEGTTFIVINELFFHLTLDSIALNGAPLSSEDSGFVMGQVFDGLNYLHEQGWVHGNVDPRSILVLSRDLLFIKLADTALSGMADLGKPDGYHDLYASQRISPELDEYPKDIWSAGVVGLHLLHGKLPERTTYTLTTQGRYVAQLEGYVRSLSRKKSPNDGLHFLTKVMKAKVQDRQTAKELLKDPWIQQTRNYQAFRFPESRLANPEGSRQTSVGPSNTLGRQSSAGPSKSTGHGVHAPGSRHTSVGPLRHSSRHGSHTSSKNTIDGFNPQRYDPTSRAPSKKPSRQSSTDPLLRAIIDSRTYPGDDYNDFDSEHETSTSQSSRFTANPLAREPRTPTPIPYEPEDRSVMPGRPGSSRKIPGRR